MVSCHFHALLAGFGSKLALRGLDLVDLLAPDQGQVTLELLLGLFLVIETALVIVPMHRAECEAAVATAAGCLAQ